MNRAIYVGKVIPGDVHYGQTGTYERVVHGMYFRPDGGTVSDVVAVGVSRAEVYIPSKDQKRHCPKP